MTPLTEHFNREEFELDGPMPDECVPVYTLLCAALLEPIRAQFNTPIEITSGYRPPAANEQAHGVKNSQHVATADYCAADFRFPAATDMGYVFFWLRNNGSLMWDQTILEHDPTGPGIIHVSITRTINRRQALEGETANQSAYTALSVAPLIPAVNVDFDSQISG